MATNDNQRLLTDEEIGLGAPGAGAPKLLTDSDIGLVPKRTWGEAIKDTGAQLAEGVNTTLGAIPSVVAPQSKAAGFFRDNADYWRDQQSDVLKGRIAETDKRIEEAGKDGLLSQIGTAASEYWNDPAQAARLVATNLPSMAATLGTGAAAGLAARGVAAARGLDAAGKAALAAKYGTTTAAATNTALNAGGARGEAFEDLQKTALAQGMTPEQAEQAGVSGSILPGVVGGVAGAISGKIGLEKAILGQATTGAAMRKAAGAFGAELAGEQIEELAPKVATNYQVGQIDPARGLTDGLGRTMVETAIGSGPGAVVAGGAAGMRSGDQPPVDPATAPGAADPSAPVPPGAAPVEAPDLQATAPATEEAPSPIQPEAVEPAPLTPEQRMAELDERMGFIDQQAKANGWDKRLIDARDETRAELDALRGSAPTEPPAFDAPGIDPIRQMVKQAADAGGALSAAAGVALDLGVTNAQFLGATGRDVQLSQTSPGVTDESNIIDVDAREVPDQRGIPTARRLTNEQGGARATASQTLALPAPTSLREGLERIRAQKQEAANAKAATAEAAPATTAVPTARPGAVEAAGPATIPATTGATSVPQASQTQQGSAQPTQAGGPQAGPAAAPSAANTGAAGGNRVQAAGLTDGTTIENPGAQGTPAAGAQGQAPQTAVARPDGWRKTMLRAAPIARAMGIDPTGKRLAQVVAEIDAADAQSGGAVNTMRDLAQQFRDRHAITKQDTDRTFAAVLDQFAGEVEQGKRTPQSVQQAIERYQELAAEPFQATQPAPATHADPGQSPEVATPAVVAQSVQKAARNEDTKPSEMRKWLVGKIDEAIAVAPEAAVDFLSFDVPGDGTFKVQNSQARLQEFRKKVMASPGFKDGGQKQAKPQQNDSILNGGGTTETIRAFLADGDVQGAVEFAKLKGVEFTPVEPRASITANGKFKRVPASVKSSVPSVAEGLTQVEAEQINQYLTAEQARAEPADAQDADVQQSPQDFIPAPDGGLDYGEITPEMGKAMRRQAGKIKLQQGNERFGLTHIEKRHGEEIRNAGFASVQEFVADIAKNIDQVWKPDATSQLVALHMVKNDRVMFVQLQAETDGGRDFYTVNTAFPSRAGYVSNKKNWEMLWEGRAQPSQPAASEQAPFAVSPQEAGRATTIPSGQSAASVPPNAPAAQPITRADVEDAQQQASADNRKKVETKEDDTGNVVKFSRNGARGITPEQRAENFARWSDNAPLISSEQAEAYDFKTGQKIVVEAFHGSARPDRIGGVFDPKRATSGPMAYFTSSPELASSYAKGKEDTSLADEDQSYANWFKFKPPGARSAVSIDRAWHFQTPEVQARIRKLAPQIAMDDTGENIVIDPDNTDGLGNYGWELQQARGNPLAALVESWLSSGTLFNEETKFMDVLRMAGFPVAGVEMDFPNAAYPGVFKTYISMKNPLVVGDMPADVRAALEQAAKADRTKAKPGADMWDKRSHTLRDWWAKLNDPDPQTAAYAWTSIPDKVTDVLKAHGYDGIVDWSGKGGGHQSPVYIPFGPTQVKSVFNRGTFDPTKKDISFGRGANAAIGTPAATIRAAITKAYGKLLGQLESKGLVTLTQTQEQAIEAAAQARADKTGEAVEAIKRSMATAMQGETDVDVKRSANGAIQGFFDPQTGQSFLIADNLTAEAAPGVLMHEVGIHMAADGSMKALFNRAAMMLKLQRGNPFMKAVQARMDAAGETSGEEAAAYIAEAYENDRANAPASVQRWLADLLAAVKAWMFKKGIMGADRLTVADIAAVARANARSMARDGGATGGHGFGPAFSHAPAGDQTQTEAFKRWFAGSKVVDAEGKPLRVYHGTRREFSIFEPMKPRAAYGNPVGIYFTDDINEAKEFSEDIDGATDERSRVVHAYLSIQSDSDGIIRKRKDGTTEYIVFKPEKIKSATGNNGDFDPSNPDIRFSRAGVSNTGGQAATGWDAPTPTGFDDVIYKLQDKNIDLKRVVESISKATGKVADSINAYLKEELFHKRAAKRVADFGDRELKPLMNKMRLAGLSMEDVEEYLHARHAKEANAALAERNPSQAMINAGRAKAAQEVTALAAKLEAVTDKTQRGILQNALGNATKELNRWNAVVPYKGTEESRLMLSGMSDKDADSYFAKLDPAQRRKLEAVAKSVDAIIDGTRKLYVDYGLEDQAVVDGWASMYQHYIPLMREDKDGGMGTGQGFSVKGRETKGRTGSTRKVVDILANVAMQREKLIVRGEKNIVAQALVGLAQANPNPDFWEVRSQAPTERVFDPKTGVVVDRPDPLFKSRENVAVAKVKDANGKVTEQMVVFNEDNPRAVRMAAAMKNLDAGNLEGLLGVSAKITRYFAAINTQYNPVFGVVNLVRDVQGAMVNLGTTPLAGQQGKIAKDTLSALRGIYSDIRKTRKGGQATSQWSQLWEQMQDDGGTTGYRDLFKTSADRANDLKSILNPEGWMDSKWGKFFTADGRLKVPLSMAQKGATEIFGWLSDYNEAMENGVRLAAYKAALDKKMSREQAASLAKNLTVNFNRKGQAGMQAGAVYAFFNAAMQGTARIGQTLFDMDGGDLSTLRLSKIGKAVVYGGVMLGVMQALALSAAGFDDDDPPEFVRERSLIIPTGDKTYVSIPMPLGLHVIPGIGRHATEFALSGFDKPAKRAVSMVGMFADAFNPIGNAGLSMQTIAPTALDPLVALSENKDWTGKPIARVSSNKAMPGHTQWKDTATGFSKVVAEAINWISGGNEYVAGAFSPTPDQIDYLLAQVGGGVAREAAKVQQTISTAMSGETLPTHKIPLVGRFVGNAASQASQGSAFYANLNKLNELETELKGLRKDGRFDEAAKLARENPQSMMIAMANRAERDVQRLRREKRELIANDASSEQVRAKEDQITAVMTRLNEAVERRKAQAAR